MRLIIAISLFAFFILSRTVAQCDCDPIPPSGGTSVTVNSVSELNNALDQANSNNGNLTILLNTGTYQLTSNLRFISSNMANLTIRGASGNRDDVVIKGLGWNNNQVTHIFNVAADNFTLADVTIGEVFYHPIQIHSNNNSVNDADNCLIYNVRIYDAKEQLLKVSGGGNLFADNGRVECCLFEFTAGIAYQYYTGGIDAHRSLNWTVKNNVFRGIRSPESRLAEHAIHFWRESGGTIVSGNQISNCDRGIGFGLGDETPDGHTGGLIKNNFVHTNRDVGIGLESSPNSKVYHNTVITENYSRSIEYRFATTSNVHIANNITNAQISDRSSGSTGSVESNYQVSDLSIFTDAATYDYHLNGITTDISDMGIALGDVQDDFDCESRPKDGGPDLGADEFNSITTDVVLESSGISLYPNLVENTFTIEGLLQDYDIDVLDANGQVHQSYPQSSGTVTIDISGLPNGLYFVRINHKQSAWMGMQLILKT